MDAESASERAQIKRKLEALEREIEAIKFVLSKGIGDPSNEWIPYYDDWMKKEGDGALRS